MKEKVTLPALTQLVALRSGCTKKQAEDFLKEFFVLISSTLVDGDQVKIKDLGVFKTITVEARKSVNVSTGDEHEIPSHRKVVFVPSKELAALVNEPFEMFETVELFDDTLTPDSEVISEETTEEPIEEIVEETPEESQEEPVKEPVKESEEDAVVEEQYIEDSQDLNVYTYPFDEADETSDTIQSDKTISSTQQANPTQSLAPANVVTPAAAATAEPAQAEAPAKTVESVESVESVQTVQPEEAVETIEPVVPVDTAAAVESTDIRDDKVVKDEDSRDKDDSDERTEPVENQADAESEYQDRDDDYERHEKRKTPFWIGFMCGLISMAIIGLIVHLCIGFSSFEKLFPNYGPQPVAVVDTVAEVSPKLSEAVADSAASLQSETTNELAAENVAEGKNVRENKNVSVNSNVEDVAPTQPSDVANKSKVAAAPAKRYDTITKTRYLTTMAKQYYGSYHLWPYIYEENKAILGHPDRIKPGTQVVIPDLKKYGVNPNNPDDIAKAKKKGAEIYSRYK